MLYSRYTSQFLPENREDFQQLDKERKLKYIVCTRCARSFSSRNTTTEAGWRETQISGYCETCFDKEFPDE